MSKKESFSTIRFYIILKRGVQAPRQGRSFSTIRFYIILKLTPGSLADHRVSVPYVFTSFSNLHRNFLHLSRVSVPYVFTSFSNQTEGSSQPEMFQYHTFLHHSQTSNSKMNRHHLRKTRYSNTFNRFHIDLYL